MFSIYYVCSDTLAVLFRSNLILAVFAMLLSVHIIENIFINYFIFVIYTVACFLLICRPVFVHTLLFFHLIGDNMQFCIL